MTKINARNPGPDFNILGDATHQLGCRHAIIVGFDIEDRLESGGFSLLSDVSYLPSPPTPRVVTSTPTVPALIASAINLPASFRTLSIGHLVVRTHWRESDAARLDSFHCSISWRARHRPKRGACRRMAHPSCR
jgi:hypothetical protein